VVIAILLGKPTLLRYVILSYVMAFYLRQNVTVLHYFGNPMNIEFLIGVALSNVPGYGKGKILVPMGFALLAAAGYFDETCSLKALQNGNESLRVIVYGIPGALIVFGMLQITVGESSWTKLGDASYSIYLIHASILNVLLTIWSLLASQNLRISTELLLLLNASVVIMFCFVLFNVIETRLLAAIPARLNMPSIAIGRRGIRLAKSQEAAGVWKIWRK
jgi:exopolysaccharide production protein ExoZ